MKAKVLVMILFSFFVASKGEAEDLALKCSYKFKDSKENPTDYQTSYLSISQLERRVTSMAGGKGTDFIDGRVRFKKDGAFYEKKDMGENPRIGYELCSEHVNIDSFLIRFDRICDEYREYPDYQNQRVSYKYFPSSSLKGTANRISGQFEMTVAIFSDRWQSQTDYIGNCSEIKSSDRKF